MNSKENPNIVEPLPLLGSSKIKSASSYEEEN